MKVIISGIRVNLADATKAMIEEKLATMDKYFHQEVTARVTVSEQKGMMKIEVTIPISKSILRAEDKDRELPVAVDNVVSKLSRQMRKHKTKLQSRENKSIRFENVEAYQPNESETDDMKIVRRKRFSTRPMSEEEAILQMDLVDHDFYVFQNAETNVINVVYKRYNGSIGIMEPDDK